MMVMEQNLLPLYLSLYFNKDYASTVNNKINRIIIDKTINFVYVDLSYLEYKILISSIKKHKLFINHFRAKESIGYSTTIKFKINTNKKRLLTLIKTNRLYLLDILVEDHYRSFCKNCQYIPISFSKVNSLNKETIFMKEFEIEALNKATQDMFIETSAEEELQNIMISENVVTNLTSFES